jgi:hypothetical protein
MFYKDLKKTDKRKIIKFLEGYGFKVKDNPTWIEFSKNNREFSFSHTDLTDEDFGLCLNFDINNFLSKNYKHKIKHSQSFQDKLYNKKYSLDKSLQVLHWKINDCFQLNDLENLQDNYDDPFDEYILEVDIKGSPHLIYNDNIYEGLLAPIRDILNVNKDLLLDTLSKEHNFLKILQDKLNTLDK